MIIDGIVAAVGERYAGYLEKSIPLWADTLDCLVIVTDHHTKISTSRTVPCIRTDLFTAFGAYLNKGAALASAFGFLTPRDWVLNFDADIVPPKNWREIVEPLIEPGNLYGCRRTYENGEIISDPPPFPYSFFHLWNVRDPHSWVRPLWALHWPSAGHYEMDFVERWPVANRVELPFTVMHPLAPRIDWFGDSALGRQKMAEELAVGHHRSRLGKHFVLKVPDFKKKICLSSTADPEWIMHMLLNHTTLDPFDISIRVGAKAEDDETFMGLW